MKWLISQVVISTLRLHFRDDFFFTLKADFCFLPSSSFYSKFTSPSPAVPCKIILVCLPVWTNVGPCWFSVCPTCSYHIFDLVFLFFFPVWWRQIFIKLGTMNIAIITLKIHVYLFFMVLWIVWSKILVWYHLMYLFF